MSPDPNAVPAPFRCGTVAIVGRPNVGKSTLLNRLVGQKISITSRKPQTTRHRITGVLSGPTAQYVFVDTPGFQTRHTTALNRSMNRAVHGALADIDAVLFVVEPGRFGAEDRVVLELFAPTQKVLLVINKVETMAERAALLPYLQARASEFDYHALVPVSAKTGLGCELLLAALAECLPEQEAIFAADELTDRSERFLVAELIREKVFRLVGDELPYGSTVMIDQFIEEPSAEGARFCRIAATILVERQSHKAMVIGRAGEKLKQIGSAARTDIERLLDARTHLELWVKVKSGWSDDKASLKSYGYE